MAPELKLIITDNKRVIEAISQETLDTHPSCMIKAVNEFRLQINNVLTKLIEDPDDTCDLAEEDEGDDSDEDIEVSCKKRKK